jgi:hypothetical protein
VADAAGVVRLPRRREMPVRGQLCGDCSQASPLPVLGDLALCELAERNGAAERDHPNCRNCRKSLSRVGWASDTRRLEAFPPNTRERGGRLPLSA